jgi:tetratricopeptide (TPR) repeat protein
MPDSRRHGLTDAEVAGDRDAQAEALLVAGLDQYFNGQYEEAIHLWTRVLFLDRSHARARAYIDRARTALAERLRLAEEMLETSRELLAQGQTDAARHLLTEAVATSGEDERASALRVKLDRLEQLARTHAPASRDRTTLPASTIPVSGWQWPRRPQALMGIVALTLISGLVVLAVTLSPSVQSLLGWRSATDRLVSAAPPPKWPLLSSSDVALIRARNLFGRGRLAEALQALERVGPSSPVRAEADALRVQIQQMLLAGSLDRFRTKAGRQ